MMDEGKAKYEHEVNPFSEIQWYTNLVKHKWLKTNKIR
jgi:hypothetical protein